MVAGRPQVQKNLGTIACSRGQKVHYRSAMEGEADIFNGCFPMPILRPASPICEICNRTRSNSMKQSRISTGGLLSVLLVTTVLLSCHDTGSAKGTRAQSENSAQAAAGPPQQLSPEGQAAPRGIT